MIRADLHTHTAFSHGQNTVREMFEAGQRRGLVIQGFSEHSPRPDGYTYPTEYREKLTLAFPVYLEQVRALAREAAPEVTVLLGVEMDWLEEEEPFIRDVLEADRFDYVIGGIHFLGTWGFDATADDWADFSEEELDCLYTRYYLTMRRMAQSGLFQIVAHPDLIKIFTREHFDAWLDKPESLPLIRRTLEVVRDAGMALEISSAGLRKPCAEIYPGPRIMALAQEVGLPISFASDAHCVNTVAAEFDTLARYAAQFGYRESRIFNNGQSSSMPF